MEKQREKIKLNIPLLLLVVLLAANMRASYTGVGTVVNQIQAELGLSSAAAGMITTIPIIVFAIICPLASAISEKISVGKMLEWALIFVCIGVGLRALFGAFGLFTGTALMAVGVGIMNSLMIVLIKLRFPAHVGLVSSLYTTTMSVTTAMSMAINVPLSGFIGWRGVLAMWVIAALAAIILWAPQSRLPDNAGGASRGEKGLIFKMMGSWRAWLLLGYMGTQSLLFYCMSAWLPSILQWRGMAPGEAAGIATTLQIISLATTLLVPIFREKLPWRGLVMACNGCYIGGALFFGFSPLGGVGFWIAIVLLALGVGTGFSVCIFLFSARSASPAEASAISGFAQCGGYVLAAVGPVLMGRLFDISGSWVGGMVFWFVILIAMTIFSWFSTEKAYILQKK